MNWKRAALVVLLVSPLFVILAAGFGQDPHQVPFMLKDKPAPGFALVTLDGKPFDAEKLRGKPAILNFWATWCVPCVQEHGLLQSAARYYEGSAHFVGVVYQDEKDAAQKYLSKHGNRFAQCMDQDSRTAIDYGVAGVPESFIIDAEGVVRYKHEGPLTKPIIERELEPLIDRSEGKVGGG
ncbi:MAG: DsbE family thiol:disulfide interchange protein [Myxococcota bacterium]